ncbi:MAG: DUF4160 domain-containing protein [Verrucomicrobiota bacterium]
MPEISRFYGIRITMNMDDHLPPHFHAEYAGEDAMVSIYTGAIIRGEISARSARLVKEWAELHRAELEENWERSQSEQQLLRIAPLP